MNLIIVERRLSEEERFDEIVPSAITRAIARFYNSFCARGEATVNFFIVSAIKYVVKSCLRQASMWGFSLFDS